MLFKGNKLAIILIMSMLIMIMMLSACGKSDGYVDNSSENITENKAAGESKNTPGNSDSGDNISLEEVGEWQAKWIWEEDNVANSWVAFRKTLTLDEKPESAVAKIAADSSYWLFVNDEMVVFDGGKNRGPNSSDGYYDSVNLTEYLRSGENTIVALVWFMGEESSYSSISSGQGGFLFQMSCDGDLLISDDSWKANRISEYKQSSDYEAEEDQPNHRLPESNIYYIATEESDFLDFTLEAFDDSKWENAKVKGNALDDPWNGLVERDIPLTKFSDLKDYENSSEYEGITISEDTVLEMRLPYNAHVTPYIEIESEEGKTITIKSDYHADPVGNGNSLKATYISKSGQQKFEALSWINGENIYYSVESGVTIKSIKYRESGYDTEFAGSFHSDDEFLNSLWEKSARTVYVCMRDLYMDCPNRERSQWWADATTDMMTSFYAFDRNADALYKSSLTSKLGFYEEDGTFRVIQPATNLSKMPMQELCGICGMWEYYMNSGDEELMRQAYPAVKEYLDYWVADENGLYTSTEEDITRWYDWGTNADEVCIENAWYYMALGAAKNMAELAGEDDDAKTFEEKRSGLYVAYQSLWTENGYLSKVDHLCDDRANALAVISGLADEDKYEVINQTLNGIAKATPYMEKYVLDAYMVMGDADGAINRMKTRYYAMVESEDACSTLWEHWGRWYGSSNHGWASGPLVTMSRDMAGIKPIEEGYTKYQIKPMPGSLKEIECCVESVIGTISMTYEKIDNELIMSVTAPEGGTAVVGIPVSSMDVTELLVNSKNTSFEISSDGYIYLELEAGSYDIIAR